MRSRRVGVYNIKTTGGGGGPPPTPGAARWGPDFGNPPEIVVGCKPLLSKLGLRGSKSVAVQATQPRVGIKGQHSVLVTPTQPELALGHNKQVGVDVSLLQYRIVGMLASKDTWAPDVAGCLDNANKNDTEIQIEGTATTKKNGYIGFPVAALPAGATVTDASYRVVVSAVSLLSPTVQTRLIPTGSEGWSETTLTCSNQPADDGEAALNYAVAGSNAGGAPGNTYTTPLSAAGRTRLGNRMGVGTFSLRLQSATIGTNVSFFDKEGVAADSPQLNLTFTVPV